MQSATRGEHTTLDSIETAEIKAGEANSRGLGVFPATYSVLAPDALLGEVAKAYPIATPMACQLLKRGLNDTYLLQSRDEHYIARVYRAQWRTPSEIAYELELLLHLAAKSVSVSTPIATRDDNLLCRLSMPEGTRYLVLFTYAAGRPLSWKDEQQSFLAGRVLAMIHAASDDFVSRHARRSLDLEYLIDRPLAAIRPFLAHRPGDWAYLEGLAARLRQRAIKAAAAGRDWGVCHGDFGAKNLHITNGQTLTVFDFDRCGPGWRAFDFALIQWGAMGSHKSAMWPFFLKGYTATRRLAAGDVLAVPAFHAICHLSNLGILAENALDWGRLRVSDWLLNRELAFSREWEDNCHTWRQEVNTG